MMGGQRNNIVEHHSIIDNVREDKPGEFYKVIGGHSRVRGQQESSEERDSLALGGSRALPSPPHPSLSGSTKHTALPN